MAKTTKTAKKTTAAKTEKPKAEKPKTAKVVSIEDAIKVSTSKKSPWKWRGHEDEPSIAKNEWFTTEFPDGDISCPRIKKIDDKTYGCYRNAQYLGSVRTLEEAKQKCYLGEKTPLDIEVKKWEKEHPGELPPFLVLTDSERKAFRHHNPPKPGAPSARERERPKEDPATTRLREVIGAVDKGQRRATKAAEKAALSGTIARLKDGNPKKAGTGAHKRWAVLFEHVGKTVEDYAQARGNMTTLENAIKAGYVKLEA